MAHFIYSGEVKLDRNHVLVSTLKRRLETHYIQPSELSKVNVRHYPHASFYESGNLNEMTSKMGEQIFNSLPEYKRPAGILFEQTFSPEVKYILVKNDNHYDLVIKR